MDWLQEHIQIIIVVASAIAYWINQRRRQKQGLPADYDGDGIPEVNPPKVSPYDPATMEAEEADRTRRLMEEMRRKRAAREANPGAPTAPAPVSQGPVVLPPPRRFETAPPVFQDPLAEMMKELGRRYTQQPEQAQEAPAVDRAALKRQMELEEKLRNLEIDKRVAEKKAAAFRSALAQETSAAAAGDVTTNLMKGLRDPASLRKAILLNEVLGKPVALQAARY